MNFLFKSKITENLQIHFICLTYDHNHTAQDCFELKEDKQKNRTSSKLSKEKSTMTFSKLAFTKSVSEIWPISCLLVVCKCLRK